MQTVYFREPVNDQQCAVCHSIKNIKYLHRKLSAIKRHKFQQTLSRYDHRAGSHADVKLSCFLILCIQQNPEG